jgi:hypothetical protein
VAGSFSWDASSNTVKFTPSDQLVSLMDYTVTIGTGIKDLAGNNMERMVVTSMAIADTVGPVVGRVSFDGRGYVEGDVIAANAVITADINDPGGLNYSKLYLKFGPNVVKSKSDFKSQDAYAGNQLRYQVSPALAAGDYTVAIEVYDAAGNLSTWEGKVKVYGGEVNLVPGTSVITTPSIISASSSAQAAATGGLKVTMAYNLTTDGEIDIYIYSPDGRLVSGNKYVKGTMGGQAGYNAVDWGLKDVSGNPVGNGVYAFRVINKGRVLGTGYIVVIE